MEDKINLTADNSQEKVSLDIVKNYASVIQFVRNQTEEICLAAVRQNGNLLMHVNNQTTEICLAALNENSDAIQFVKKQTPELCLYAVKNNGKSLRFIIEQTEEICLAAVNHDGWALEFVKNQTEELCLAAVNQNGHSLKYVQNKTERLCLAAVLKDKQLIVHSDYIDDVLFLAFLNSPHPAKFEIDFIFTEKKVFKGPLVNYIKCLYDDRIIEIDIFNEFQKDAIIFCAKILSDFKYEYIYELKNKIPEVFKNNIDLMSVYEKMLLEKNINKLKKDKPLKNLKKF